MGLFVGQPSAKGHVGHSKPGHLCLQIEEALAKGPKKEGFIGLTRPVTLAHILRVINIYPMFTCLILYCIVCTCFDFISYSYDGFKLSALFRVRRNNVILEMKRFYHFSGKSNNWDRGMNYPVLLVQN